MALISLRQSGAQTALPCSNIASRTSGRTPPNPISSAHVSLSFSYLRGPMLPGGAAVRDPLLDEPSSELLSPSDAALAALVRRCCLLGRREPVVKGLLPACNACRKRQRCFQEVFERIVCVNARTHLEGNCVQHRCWMCSIQVCCHRCALCCQ